MDERRRRIKSSVKRGNSGNKPGRTRLTKSPIDLAVRDRASGIVLPEVKSVLKKYHFNKPPHQHRTNIIFPSEMAKADWCPRATYYRMTGLPEPAGNYSFQLENVFAEGNAIHEKWQRWLAQTGKLWGDWQCPVCRSKVTGTSPDNLGPANNICNSDGLTLHDWKYKEVTLSSNTLPVAGHADGALTEHNCLIEIKSIGLGTFKFEAPKLYEEYLVSYKGRKIPDIDSLWKNLHRPLVSHLKQGNVYLWMAEQMGLPFDKIVFLYEFKANQQVKEFTVKKSENILSPLLDAAARIAYAVGEGVPPDCPKVSCGQCKAYE